MNDYDMSSALRTLAARANAARIAFYPVHADSIDSFSLSDVTRANRRFVPSPKTVRVRAENLKAGNWILADETGGSLVSGTGISLPDLGRIADELRNQYLLGFTPNHEPEGRIHGLRVETRKKGVRSRYQPSYFHGERGDPGALRTIATLLVGLAEDTLGAEIAVDDPPAGTPAEDLAVNVKVTVPLAGAPGPERHEYVVEVPSGAGQSEIAVGVLDAHSTRATYKRVR